LRIFNLRKSVYILLIAAFWQCQSSSVKEGPQEASAEEPKNISSAHNDTAAATKIIDPNSAENYAKVVRQKLKTKNAKEAYLALLKAKQADSLNALVLETEGDYRMSLNQSRQARDAWAKCIKHNPDNIACRLKLGKLFYTVGQYEKGLDLFNAIVEIDSYQAEAYFYKALILRDFYKDSAQAKRFLQRAIEEKQDYLEALDLMGVLMSQTKDSLAPYYYQRAISIAPNNADLHYKLGVYYMQNDKLNKAIEAYTKATQINPRHADSFYNLGFMFIQIKNYQSAREFFSKALKAQPNNYKALYGRGYAYEMLGDVINAKQDYRAALKALPMYKPAAEALQRIKQRDAKN
jgi:tetratricopeptide (TPR) repeat protein